MIDKNRIWLAIKRRLQNRRLLRDSSLLMLANVIGMAFGLVRAPITTWLLPKEEYGMIGVVGSWEAFLSFLTWPVSLPAASYHYVAKGQPATYPIMVHHQLRWSVLSILGFLGSAAYWWWQGSHILAILFILGGLTFPFRIILASCVGMLAAQEKFVGLFWYRISRNLARFTGFIFLLLSIWWLSPVIIFYFSNQIVISILNIAFTIWLMRQLQQEQVPSISAEDKQEMMHYGKHLTGINAIGIVQSNIDRFLISTFLPLEVMADYSIGMLIYTQMKQIWIVYLSVRYPPFVRTPVQKRRRKIIIEGSIVWVGFVVAAFTLSIIAYWLVPIVLPPSYTTSLGYINWLLATFVVGIPGFFSTVYFRTEQNEKSLYLLQSISVTFNVILQAILIVPLNAYGVVIGRCLSNVIYSIVGVWLFWYKGLDKNKLTESQAKDKND